MAEGLDHDTAPPKQPEREPAPDFVRVIGHSNLFYWWPVWLVGFVLAGLTYAEDYTLAAVPPGSVAAHDRAVEGFDGPRDVLVSPANAKLPSTWAADGTAPAGVRVNRSNGPGVVFVFVLVITAVVSTMTFRGLISVIVIALMAVTVLALALLGWWDDIFHFVGGLEVRINAAGYLAVALPLFVMWLFTVFVYDPQRYVIFDQGQIRLHKEVGDSEKVMDANGVTVERLRADVFRHWLFGLGSGDLRIRAGNGREIEVDNVLNIGRKLVVVQRMLQERQVSAAVASPTVGGA